MWVLVGGCLHLAGGQQGGFWKTLDEIYRFVNFEGNRRQFFWDLFFRTWKTLPWPLDIWGNFAQNATLVLRGLQPKPCVKITFTIVMIPIETYQSTDLPESSSKTFLLTTIEVWTFPNWTTFVSQIPNIEISDFDVSISDISIISRYFPIYRSDISRYPIFFR